MFTFSEAQSHALTNATRRHEYFRGLRRLLPVSRVLMSFPEIHFLGKMDLLALRGLFDRENEAQEMTPKLLALIMKSAQSSEIFMTSCGICQSVGECERKVKHLGQEMHKKRPGLKFLVFSKHTVHSHTTRQRQRIRKNCIREQQNVVKKKKLLYSR